MQINVDVSRTESAISRLLAIQSEFPCHNPQGAVKLTETVVTGCSANRSFFFIQIQICATCLLKFYLRDETRVMCARTSRFRLG